MAQKVRNRLPGAQDAARLVKSTVDETVSALSGYYGRGPVNWSYNPVRFASKAIFSGELTKPTINNAFDKKKKNGKFRPGAKSNLEVALLLYEHAKGRQVFCHDIKPRKVALSRDLFLTINPRFYFVENGLVKVHWLQPRREYALDFEQAGVLAALLRISHFRDDFEDAELELFDVSVDDNKERQPKSFGLNDLPNLTEVELTERLEILLHAYLKVCNTDFDSNKKPRKERAHIDDGVMEFDFNFKQ